MKFPIHKHCISIRNSRLEILSPNIVNTQNGADYADEVDKICERGKDWCFVLKVTRIIFGEGSRSGNALEEVNISGHVWRDQKVMTHPAFIFVVLTG